MENASLHIFDILMFLKMLKMVSAKRSSNKMISAKIKLPKNTHSMVTFWIRKEEIILTPQEKIELEVIHILIEKTLHVGSKQNGARF